MKANDVFIVSAIGMQLINKFIWIKPSWINGEYQNKTIIIGLTHKFKESYDTQLCMCEQPKRWGNRNKKPLKCVVMDPQRDGIKEIDISDCLIKTEYRFYEVGEKYAVKLLTAIRKKEKSQPKVILDIDEDYFGVENRTKAFERFGGRAEDISTVDEATGEVFCPKPGGDYENRANEFMLQYIKSILTHCYSNKHKCTKSKVLDIGEELQEKLNEKLRTKLFCNKAIGSEFSKLASKLWSVPKNTLEALLKFKFCNFGIPALGMDIKFQTCKGVPNNNEVEYHIPDETEVRDRAARLNSVVSFIFEKYATPGVTTVCRSMRDGYTPLNHFQSIEKYITDGLKNASGQKNRLNFHYDDKLVFGTAGWKAEEDKLA